MSSQLEKYLHFNASKPSSKYSANSITFLPAERTPKMCIYYKDSKEETSRTNSRRSVLSEMSSRMSANSSFKQFINPPIKMTQCYRFPIKMHRCSQPMNQKQAQKMQAIESKRFQVQKLRRSLSERKIVLQNKYDQLLKRSQAIKRFYESQPLKYY